MAFRDLLNRWFYGKEGKADFTEDMLPDTRPALFADMLRAHASGMIALNFLYVLFCLPGILWTFYSMMVSIAAYSAAREAGGAFSLVGSGYLFTWMIGMIPCMTVAGAGSTGEMFVLRNWARDEHAYVWKDFRDALRANWKRGALTGFLQGLSLPLCHFALAFYGAGEGAPGPAMIPLAFVLIGAAVWWMMNMLVYPMMVTYELGYGALLRNCAIISVARLPYSALFLLLTFGVPALLLALLPWEIILSALSLWYLTAGFAFTGFIYASYANSCFDLYLNPKIPGAEVRRGLRKRG